ncbi:MAG: tetratricopeptide repeat protein [Myxococcaceae bacterium]|nr:tetratricopeptide repeat protein [Myxococcaceae bacterium]
MRLFVLLLALAAPASMAQTAEARARALALEGKKAFDVGDFRTAIERYEAAYRLKAAPGLLFNLGQCHRKVGALDEALSFFRRYLESNPPEAQAKATEQVIAELQAQRELEAEQRRVAEEAARAEAARQRAEAEADAKRKADEARVAAARAEAEAAARKLELELAQRQKPEAGPPPLTQRWYFWAGVAAVVIGGAVTATAFATAPRPTPTTFPDINAR